MARSGKKRKASLGVLFWIAFILFVLVVFLFNRAEINRVLERTRLLEVVSERFGGEEGPTEEPDTRPLPAPGEGLEEPLPPPGDPPEIVEDTGDEESEPTDRPDSRRQPTEESEDSGVAARDDSAEQSDAQNRDDFDDSDDSGNSVAEDQNDTEEVRQEQARRARRASIYYIRVTDDGGIFVEPVERTVLFVDSPMTETIRVLLSGPTSSELERGLLNLIPEGTELLSAAVREGVAYLNFNENFAFNPLGLEGALGQLKQIVYSTTEFTTIERVQFLIDGQRVEYLGGDGVFIGNPLGREAFS
jgi:spore germination protein GerM